jgi:DNA-binding NarL/FixJ family response regulator
MYYIASLKENDELTVRQKQVLQLLGEGRTMKEVAFVLNVSTRTVAFHKYTIMQHLQIKSNVELLRYAMKNQMLAA